MRKEDANRCIVRLPADQFLPQFNAELSQLWRGQKTRFCQPRAETKPPPPPLKSLWQLPLRWQCQKFVPQTTGGREAEGHKLRLNDAQLCEYLAQSVYRAWTYIHIWIMCDREKRLAFN